MVTFEERKEELIRHMVNVKKQLKETRENIMLDFIRQFIELENHLIETDKEIDKHIKMVDKTDNDVQLLPILFMIDKQLENKQHELFDWGG